MVSGSVRVVVNSIKCIKDIEKYKDDQKERINKAIHNAGFMVEGEVKMSIAGQLSEPRSVDTGHFMGTVGTDTIQEYVAFVYSPVDYSKYLEYGTSRFEGRHHFRNSFQRKRSEILDMVKEASKP